MIKPTPVHNAKGFYLGNLREYPDRMEFLLPLCEPDMRYDNSVDAPTEIQVDYVTLKLEAQYMPDLELQAQHIYTNRFMGYALIVKEDMSEVKEEKLVSTLKHIEEQYLKKLPAKPKQRRSFFNWLLDLIGQ